MVTAIDVALREKNLKLYANRYPSVPFVFLFSGKAGVGKTYSANILKAIFEEKKFLVFLTHFAEGVKEVAKDWFGWDGLKDERGRCLLQDIGAVGRSYDQEIWAKTTFNRYIPHYEDIKLFSPDIILVDDWRFPNEYNYIESLNKYIITRIRINAPSREILKGTSRYLDTSEVSLDNYDFDFTIDNEGTEQALRARLLGIYKTYFERG